MEVPKVSQGRWPAPEPARRFTVNLTKDQALYLFGLALGPNGKGDYSKAARHCVDYTQGHDPAPPTWTMDEVDERKTLLLLEEQIEWLKSFSLNSGGDGEIAKAMRFCIDYTKENAE